MRSEELKPFEIYSARNSLVVFLKTDSIPFFHDCVASDASVTGVDLTNPNNWDKCDDAALCWNILSQQHEFHNPANLHELSESDGHVPFDHATGQLRSILSLLKHAQDKFYKKEYFSTSLLKKV